MIEQRDIIKIFKNEKDANNFHEELISNPSNKRKKFFVEEFELIE
jgi:hypothetical protein